MSAAQPDIGDALARRTLALFIGADLTVEVTGLPSRADLARELARRHGLDETLPLAEVAQRVSRAGNRFEFTAFIRQALDVTGHSPQPFQQRIVDLVKTHQLALLITTAYDGLIEAAFRAANAGFNRAVRGGDLSFVDPDRPTLLKLYGDVQQPDTLVVTDRDHSNLLRDRDREALVDEVRRAFRASTVLFLGYNLADPDFRFLFDQIAESRFARTAYAVWPGLPETDVQMWRDRNIVILDDDPFGILSGAAAPIETADRPEIQVGAPRSGRQRGSEMAPAGQQQADAAPETRRERGWVQFKLQIARLSGQTFEARAFETPMGEPQADGYLPYDAAELMAVLKVLEHGSYDPARFSESQTAALQRLALVREERLVARLLPQIGSGLYQALFPEQVGTALQMALNQARSRRDTVALQLRFDHEAVDLARYPWELLHDGQRHLLSGGAVELSRYIAYPEATTTLPASPPWRLLYVAARPRDLETLPDEAERLAVWSGLAPRTDSGQLLLELLEPPTYDALLARLAEADVQIIHFDGHGIFARRCPDCATMHYPHLATCQTCGRSLEDVSPQGYLAFETGGRETDYVSTEDLQNLVYGSEVRLMLLSACQSAVVRGETLFGGLGPGLIRAGVPAVLAMQFSVPVQAAINFAQSFYPALARGEPVPRAVAKGRRRLFRDKTWFLPTLYLRSTDDEGRLFVE